MAKYVKQVNGELVEEATIATSAGAGDAGKIIHLDAAGRIDNSAMPSGIGAATKTLTASEALASGDFVNVWLDSGTVKMRKADASNGREAHGFVLAAVSSTATGTMYYGDRNDQCTSLTAGAKQYLSGTTPGKPTATCPTTSGHLAQKLGVSTSTSEILVEIQQPITLA